MASLDPLKDQIQPDVGLERNDRFIHHVPWEYPLWYGDADALVPLQMGDYLSATIPQSYLTTCHGQGHLLIVQRWEEILRTLADR